jgi:hypothetical protein
MVDIISAFEGQFDERVLFTGFLNERNNKLSHNIKVEKLKRYNRSSSFKRIFTWSLAFLKALWLIKIKYRKAHLFLVSNPPFATLLPIFCKNSFDVFKTLNSITSMINSKKNDTENINIVDDITEVSEVNQEIINEEENTDEIIKETEVNTNEIVTEPNNDVLTSENKEQPKKNKITLEDIKEIKEQNRGYSVNVPIPKGNNMIESIGSNKIIRDGNKDKVIYKRFK